MPKPFLAVLLLCLAGGAAAAPPSIARFADPRALSGRWNGVDLELRSNCRTPENNGSRGTYAQFDVVVDGQGNFAIDQSGVTGLNCSYTGRYELVEGRISWLGSYACTDGKRGDLRSTSVTSSATTLTIRLAIQLTSSEACGIDAILSMARFAPA